MIPGTVHVSIRILLDKNGDFNALCVEGGYGVGLNQIIIDDGFFQDVILQISDPDKLKQAMNHPAR